MSRQFYGITINNSISGPGIKERVPVTTVATTNQNLALTLIGVPINGYTLANGDRVLIAGQTTGTENGIYVTANPPYRAEDYETGADCTYCFVTVTSGNYANTTWQATTPGVVGTGTQGFVMTTNNAYSAGGLQYATSSSTRAILAAPVSSTSLLQMTTTGTPSWINVVPSSLGGTGLSSLTSRKILVTDTTPAIILSNVINCSAVQGTASSNNIMAFTDNGAANYITVANAATGAAPKISATGTDANISLALQTVGTGTYNFGATSTAAAILQLYEQTTNGAMYVALAAPASITSSFTLTLPSALGANNQLLSTTSAGVLSFRSLVSGDIPTLAYLTSFNGRTGPAITPTAGDYALAGLSDVTITTPSTNQVLQYNGTKWVNATSGGAVTSVFGRTGAVVAASGDYNLSQLGDCTITSPVINNYLRYNGTKWINSPGINILWDLEIAASLSSVTAVWGGFHYYSNVTTINIPVNNTPGASMYLTLYTSAISFPSGVNVIYGTFTSAGPQTVTVANYCVIELKVQSNSSTPYINFTILGGSCTASWQTKTITTIPAVSTLSDTVITSPSTNQVLQWNGSSWVNATFTVTAPVTSVFGRTGAVVAASGDYTLAQLGTVSIGSPTTLNTNDVLRYNGSSWVNSPMVGPWYFASSAGSAFTGTIRTLYYAGSGFNMTLPSGSPLPVGDSIKVVSATLSAITVTMDSNLFILYNGQSHSPTTTDTITTSVPYSTALFEVAMNSSIPFYVMTLTGSWTVSWQTKKGGTNPNISDIRDVTVTSITKNNLLVYSGTAWINKTVNNPMGQILFNNLASTYTLSMPTINTYVKISPTCTLVSNNSSFAASMFSMPSTARIQYLGTDSIAAMVTVQMCCTVSTAGDTYAVGIYVNGVAQGDGKTYFTNSSSATGYVNVVVKNIYTLNTNDYVEAYATDAVGMAGSRSLTFVRFGIQVEVASTAY